MNNLKRRNFVCAAAAGAATVALPQLAFGQASATSAYPGKPVTVVLGNAAGGPTDVLMRALVPLLSQALGKPVIVDNKAGASESIAAQFVANAAPDGHAILMSTEAPFTMNQFLYRKLPYNPEKDFAPITHLMNAPMALVVPASSPANTLQEFIALVKSREGKEPLNYGSAGPGSPIQLAMVSFLSQNKLNMLHVPFRGLAPVITELLADRIDAAWGGLAAVVPHVREGKLKALVIDAPERVKTLPNVPVFKETGIARSQANFIYAFSAPAGTPAPIRERLALELKKAMSGPEFRTNQIDPYGYVPIGSTPAELAQFIVKDRVAQAERIKLSGAVME